MSDRYEKGLQAMRRYFDDQTEPMIKRMKKAFPDLARINVETFGEIYDRNGLDAKTRELITIAALITLGNALPQLKVHVQGALHVGVSREEILETILQLAGYVGFPTVLNSLYMVDELFQTEEASNN